MTTTMTTQQQQRENDVGDEPGRGDGGAVKAYSDGGDEGQLGIKS